MGLGIKHRIKEKYAAYTFAYKKYREGLSGLNITIADIVKFYKYSIQHKNQKRYKTNLLGETICTFNNYFWFYHSVEEIFVDEVYKCNFNSAEPYIIDCGANIGLSVIYFKQKYPNAKIIAFEPDKFQFDNLLQNIETFNLSNIQAVNKGVWNEETTMNFFPDGTLGGTLIHSDFSPNDNNSIIELVSLKNYLAEKVDFLKIDIEGAEYTVLKDLKDQLSNVEYMFLEFHGAAKDPQHFHEILQWIHEAGFRYHIKFAWETQKHPFIEKRKSGWDLQLNVYCYRS